jgi:sugar lactone lactonase YvrE
MAGETQMESTAPSRARIILLAAVLLLLALLVGLVVVFYGLVKPTGLPEQLGKTDGMRWIRSMYGFGPATDQQLYSPASVAIGPNGDIYATDPTRARVMVFRADGTFKRLIHTGAGGTGKGQFLRPESIDIDPSGALWIADSMANKVIAIAPNGDVVAEFPVETQGRGIHVDANRVYVLDLGKVLVFDKKGTKLASFSSRGPGEGQIDAYQGITAKDGTIYIADSFNKRLQAFSEQGKLLWAVPGGTASRSGPASHEATGTDQSASEEVPDHRWDLPQDLVFDRAGRLVVIDAFNFEIAVVDPETGKVHARYGEFGRVDGQFFYPTSIAYDSRRDWFAIADTRNNRVQIVRIPGSGAGAVGVVFRSLSSPYRYLMVPLLLLLLAIALGWWAVRRMQRSADHSPTSA